MSTSETDNDKRDGLSKSDYVFEEPPAWAVGPLEAVAMDFTYDEAHAMLLGLTGVLVGLAWHVRLRVEATTLLIALVGIAFGLKRLPNDAPIAGRVVRREPWYFTTVLVVALVATVTVAGVVA